MTIFFAVSKFFSTEVSPYLIKVRNDWLKLKKFTDEMKITLLYVSRLTLLKLSFEKVRKWDID